MPLLAAPSLAAEEPLQTALCAEGVAAAEVLRQSELLNSKPLTGKMSSISSKRVVKKRMQSKPAPGPEGSVEFGARDGCSRAPPSPQWVLGEDQRLSTSKQAPSMLHDGLCSLPPSLTGSSRTGPMDTMESLTSGQYAAATALAAAAQLTAYKEEVRKLRDFIALLQADLQQAQQLCIAHESPGTIDAVRLAAHDDPERVHSTTREASLDSSSASQAEWTARVIQSARHVERQYLEQVRCCRLLEAEAEQSRAELTRLREDARCVEEAHIKLQEENAVQKRRIDFLEDQVSRLESSMRRETNAVQHLPNEKQERQLLDDQNESKQVSSCGGGSPLPQSSCQRRSEALRGAPDTARRYPSRGHESMSSADRDGSAEGAPDVSLGNTVNSVEMDKAAASQPAVTGQAGLHSSSSPSTIAHGPRQSLSSVASAAATAAAAAVEPPHSAIATTLSLVKEKVDSLARLLLISQRRMSEHRTDLQGLVLAAAAHDDDRVEPQPRQSRQATSPSHVEPTVPPNDTICARRAVRGSALIASAQPQREASQSALGRTQHLIHLNDEVRRLTQGLQRATDATAVVEEGEQLYNMYRSGSVKTPDRET